jgi:mRNA interferase MazF
LASVPSRGDVWWVNLDPTVGHEQGRKRPSVIVSTNKFNQGPSSLVMVVPITTKNRELNTWVPVEPPEGGLREPSFVMCDQLRTISRNRLLDEGALGSMTPGTMKRIVEIISILLEIR